MTDTSTSWKLASYADYDYLSTNEAGLRFTQGLVWNEDTSEWISSWQYGLARLSSDFQFLQTTGTVDTSSFDVTTGIPDTLAAMGFDHIGDIDYYNGILYVSLDSAAGDYQNGHVALLNASDLSYTGDLYELVGASTNEHNDVASWVAVDGAAGVGYGKEWQSGNTINVYNLTDWSFSGTLEMDQSLKNIQGAKVYDGMMYMASDNSTRSVYSLDLSTGHVEELFELADIENADTEMEGIEVRTNDDGNVEITVELIVDPDGDNYADTYTRLYNYVIDDGSTTGDVAVNHTWTVNTADDDTDADDNSLSLREAIAKASAGDTITFNAALAGQTLSLADVELTLAKNITLEGDLDGDGVSDITIDSGTAETAIHISAGDVTLDGVTISDGDDEDGASIVLDQGATLTFTNGAGARSVETTVDGYALGKNVENLILTGTAAFGSGNDLDNEITGSSRANILYGKAGDDTIYGDKGDDFLDGGNGNDTLYGGKNADFIKGGQGDDVINGGAGVDDLIGGKGADTFVFADGDTSAKLATADTIYDFSAAQGDIIDLSSMDANANKNGNQAFRFVGNDAFTGHSGELRAYVRDGDTYIAGDVDGDGTADFSIHLDGKITMSADYFAL